MRQLTVVVDALEEACTAGLQDALLKFGTLLSLLQARPQELHVGLGCIVRQANGRDVQLKILLRPGPFAVRDYYLAVQRLQATVTPGAPESHRTALALKSLISHLGERDRSADMQQSIQLIAHAFEANAFQKVLHMASEKQMALDFVRLSIPASGGLDEDADAQDPVAFASEIADYDNATLTYMTSEPRALQQLCLQWLRDLALAPSPRVQLLFPAPLGSGHSSLHCIAIAEVLPLVDSLEPSPVCPCHGMPLNAGAASARATASISSAFCPASGAALRLTDCATEPTMVRLGKAATLRLPPDSTITYGPCDGMLGKGDSRAAVALTETVLRVVKRCKVQELSDSLLFGTPLILAASGDGFTDVDAMEENEQLMAGLCQVLRETGEALLVSCHADVETGQPCSFARLHVALPAADGSSMLLRRITSCEEYLPIGAQLPPLCHPSEEALVAVRQSLGSLPNSPWTPLEHSRGSHALLQQLLAASLPLPHFVAPPPQPSRQQQPLTHNAHPSMAQVDPSSLQQMKPRLQLPPAPQPLRRSIPPDHSQRQQRSGGIKPCHSGLKVAVASPVANSDGDLSGGAAEAAAALQDSGNRGGAAMRRGAAAMPVQGQQRKPRQGQTGGKLRTNFKRIRQMK